MNTTETNSYNLVELDKKLSKLYPKTLIIYLFGQYFIIYDPNRDAQQIRSYRNSIIDNVPYSNSGQQVFDISPDNMRVQGYMLDDEMLSYFPT